MNKSLHILLSSLLIVGLIFTSSISALAQGPTEAPPEGPVTPTFDGLTVNGTTDLNDDTTVIGNTLLKGNLEVDTDADGSEELKINDTLFEIDYGGSNPYLQFFKLGIFQVVGSVLTFLEADWIILSTPILDIQDLSGKVDMTVDGSLELLGDMKVIGDSSEIGHFYRVSNSKTIAPGSSAYLDVKCNEHDYITGCTGYFSLDNASDRFYGAYATSTAKCKTRGGNLGGASNDYLYVYAMCFNPRGI
jgi:hypothetical protein